ncbi:MAG: LeuD/DmdB family oxidoreductase small subunit [Promethearchaeota archaeon]
MALTGKVIKYKRANINTDLIIAARYLNVSGEKELAVHCMEDLDGQFFSKKDEIGATIFVGGPNFGCGSSREHAPIALKGSGIKCVIAPTFARIFFRNAINIGLPIVEFKFINELSSGDELEINFTDGYLINKTNKKDFKIEKMPEFLQELIDIGGLVNFAAKRIKNNRKS